MPPAIAPTTVKETFHEAAKSFLIKGSTMYGANAHPYATPGFMLRTPAGRLAKSRIYQQQLTGYRAFIPSPLPPQPPIRLTGEIQRLLSEADLAHGRLDGDWGIGEGSGQRRLPND